MSNNGFETETDVEGFGIYSGCEGDCPEFVGFVKDERIAKVLCETKDEEGDPIIFDGAWKPAVLERAHIANDVDIKSHRDLWDRVRLEATGRPPERLRSTRLACCHCGSCEHSSSNCWAKEPVKVWRG